MTLELSADLGEGSPGEEEIWPLIHRANVACGGHVGDAESMRIAAEFARRYGVILGAHPSYPDREHFGRRSLSMAADELRVSLIAQLAALCAFGEVHHVKPHGALYNDAHKDRALAEVIVSTLTPSTAIVAPDASQMAVAARAAGIPVIREAFADRRYEPDGSLTPRSIPGSTLTIDEAAEQARLLAHEGAVIARDGTRIAIPFDTLCIHADMPQAVERLRAIRAAIDK